MSERGALADWIQPSYFRLAGRSGQSTRAGPERGRQRLKLSSSLIGLKFELMKVNGAFYFAPTGRSFGEKAILDLFSVLLDLDRS